MASRMYEIRWHGRGGQGAVTAAKIVAEAAFLKGYPGITATPAFGAERRGVPVSAATRISREPIRILSQVVEPDIVVVLDQTLLAHNDVLDGIRNSGWLIVNSNRQPEDIGNKNKYNVAAADATSICRELGLVVGGITLVNIAILGAFILATRLVDFDSVAEVLKERFSGQSLDTNLSAIRKTYEVTKVKRMR